MALRRASRLMPGCETRGRGGGGGAAGGKGACGGPFSVLLYLHPFSSRSWLVVKIKLNKNQSGVQKTGEGRWGEAGQAL